MLLVFEYGNKPKLNSREFSEAVLQRKLRNLLKADALLEVLCVV
jgi:hypothetical protein